MSISGTPISPVTTITTKLLYSVAPEDGSRAYSRVDFNPKTGLPETNVTREAKEVVIENIRGKEDTVSLDINGFQFFRHTSKHTSFATDEEIRSQYYPESADLIKKLTGASRVEFFDHTIRRRRPGQVDNSPDLRQPVALVHVDQTNKSSIARVHRHIPASDVPKLLKNRFQIVNLWRPISHEAIDWPLALCDYRSVNLKDTFPVALIYSDHEGETLSVKHNENQRWKYLRGMTPDEIVLIKCFDSSQDSNIAIFTPHTAFEDPTTPQGSIPRESIELRALVFYD